MTKLLVTVGALASVALIGLVDLVTGPDLAFSVFYLPAIALTAWYVGRSAALLTAFAAAATWVVAEYAARPFIDWKIHAWNGLTRLAIFVALGVLTTQLVREREKLRAIDRQREEALTFVAHELRGSVSGIETGLPSLLKVESLDSPQRKALTSLLRQAHSLKRFAEDVLAVGRFEQGSFELKKAAIDLGELVTQAARDASDPERIQLVLPSDPVPVEADPERLRLAVEHLLSNALKYSPTGSGVFVRVSAADGTARLEVRDDGVGLADSDRGILFQKYGRVRNARTAHVLGVGLGLYVTRRLIEAHGGRVEGKSVGPGLGSTFSITLPLASTSQHERTEPAPPAPEVGSASR